jgi:hypothetical protein
MLFQKLMFKFLNQLLNWVQNMGPRGLDYHFGDENGRKMQFEEHIHRFSVKVWKKIRNQSS